MNEYKFYLTLIVLFSSLLIIIFTGAFGYMTDILEDTGMGLRNIYTIYNSEHIENCVGCKEVKEGHLIVDTVISDTKDANVVSSVLTGEVTGYCLTGIMANGKEVHDGAIACPGFVPLGAKISIDGFVAYYKCEDRMGLKYRDGNFFDIWFQDCNDALTFGRQTLEVKIYK